MTEILIVRQFQDAARSLHEALPHMSRADYEKAGGDPRGLPRVKKEHWTADKKVRQENNCYSYACNYKVTELIHPGDIYCERTGFSKLRILHEVLPFCSDPDKFMNFVEVKRRHILLDGLVFLGYRFKAPSSGFPVAIFFAYMKDRQRDNHDIHCYALRRPDGGDKERVVWAHKTGVRDVYECADVPGAEADLTGPASFMADAQARGYLYFAGFYQVNAKPPAPAQP